MINMICVSILSEGFIPRIGEEAALQEVGHPGRRKVGDALGGCGMPVEGAVVACVLDPWECR